MHEIVYGHHTNNIATIMLVRSIQDLLDQGALATEDLFCIKEGRLQSPDDGTLMDLIASRARQHDCSSALEMITRIEERRLYKRGLIITRYTAKLFRQLQGLSKRPTERKQLELKLCRELLGAVETEADCRILVFIPRVIDDSVDIPIHFPVSSRPYTYDEYMGWAAVTGLSRDDLEKYQRYARQILVVTPKEYLDTVTSARNTRRLIDILTEES